MWKPEHRAAADRRGLRYESDLTDAEWALVAPLIRPAKRGGRPRTVDVREGDCHILDRGRAEANFGPSHAQMPAASRHVANDWARKRRCVRAVVR